MTNAIKKDYQAIITFLEANKGKKVSTILEEAKSMCEGKTNAKTFEKDDEGNVTRVFCYYHKQWEDVNEVPYGLKASNKATGLNTMCKQGVSQWSKQQREAKKQESLLLDKVASGELSVDELPQAKQAIEEARTAIFERMEVDASPIVEELLES